MATLFSGLGLAANSMDVIEQSIAVTQNNITNANTPGYVQQTPTVLARSFDPQDGIVGGVQEGPVVSARNQFAEDNVRDQNALLGTYTQQSASLDSLQSLFDVSGTSGIPAALSGLFSAFSAWSTSPGSASAQQQVIAAARQTAQSFNQTASGIAQVAANTRQQLQSTVSQINQYASQIQQINVQIRNGNGKDAGLDAQLNNTLEELSNLTGITAQYQSDGTATVLMGGQTPLVIGTELNQLSVQSVSGNPQQQQIVTSGGQDVTGVVNQGTLYGLLQFNNVTLAGIEGDSSQQGSLNQLAQAVSDTVNGILGSGQTSTGASGIPLFSYTAGSPSGVAQSLTVNPNISGSELAAISPGPPAVSNGAADQLAQLVNTPDATLGMTYSDFYSGIATGVGNDASGASTNETTQTDVLNQARSARAQVSGISLNDEAAQLLQFQQSYQASAQMVTVINTMAQALMTMMTP